MTDSPVTDSPVTGRPVVTSHPYLDPQPDTIERVAAVIPPVRVSQHVDEWPQDEQDFYRDGCPLHLTFNERAKRLDRIRRVKAARDVLLVLESDRYAEGYADGYGNRRLDDAREVCRTRPWWLHSRLHFHTCPDPGAHPSRAVAAEQGKGLVRGPGVSAADAAHLEHDAQTSPATYLAAKRGPERARPNVEEN